MRGFSGFKRITRIQIEKLCKVQSVDDVERTDLERQEYATER